jgi:phosphoribosylglycinamide formyltransferase-1
MESKKTEGTRKAGVKRISEMFTPQQEKSKIAIFASGAGTNAGAIMEHFKKSAVAEVVLLLSNNPEAPALQKAKTFEVPVKVFTRQQFSDSSTILDWLQESGTTHVVLAGFLWLMPSSLIRAYPKRIINIHPSLLPKFSGRGMYGMKVHEAVRTSGELETGISIHVVNEQYDEGEILFQTSCALGPDDTPETIARKVHELEYAHYPKVIEEWVK